MKRLMDLTLAIGVLIPALPLIALISLFIKCTSPGPVLHWSDRIGRLNSIFSMPKFRTMKIDTPQVATHLLTDANRWMIPGGRLLRSTSLDELPQLWSILKGDMSFVGPRPALFNQDDLVELRTRNHVDSLVPGLTGWAQINGRDELEIPVKVEFDRYYLENRSLAFDLRIIGLTIAKVFRRDGVAQAGEEAFSRERDSPATIPISTPDAAHEDRSSDRRAA